MPCLGVLLTPTLLVTLSRPWSIVSRPDYITSTLASTSLRVKGSQSASAWDASTPRLPPVSFVVQEDGPSQRLQYLDSSPWSFPSYGDQSPLIENPVRVLWGT